MNRLLNTNGSVSTDDLRRLDGKIVLVHSLSDHHNPPTAMRGWIEVRENGDAIPGVHLVVDFPQMFTVPVHRRDIPLDHAALMRLLDSEDNGTFSFTIQDELR